MTLDTIPHNKIRQLIFLSLLIIIFLILFKELYFFASSLLGAITLYVIMRNWMIHLCVKMKLKRWFSALLLLLLSFLLLVLPTIWGFLFIFNSVKPVIQNPEIATKILNEINNFIIQTIHVDIANTTTLSKVSSYILSLTQVLIGNTFNVVSNILMMYVILYFMLYESLKIELWLQKSLPFKKGNSKKFISSFKSLVYSNAIGIPIVAIIQGIVGLIGYLIFGVQNFLLMSILTAICSVIPMVGAMLVWLPLGIYTIAIGHVGAGIGIIIWGALAVGSADNVARFFITKENGRCASINYYFWRDSWYKFIWIYWISFWPAFAFNVLFTGYNLW
ncbi:MAG: membrane protein [Bacteroidetes bacterium OLB11]|nr:MAG: membrane protein [Bacteroidetes bacterium OLB11]